MIYQRRPGWGFIVFMSSLAAAVSFVVWASHSPSLSETWRILAELQTGRVRILPTNDFETLQNAFVRHPTIADNFLEENPAGILSVHNGGFVTQGSAYVVRRNALEADTLEIRLSQISEQENVVVNFHTRNANHQATVNRDGFYAWRLPTDNPFPQLIEVRVERKKKQKKLGEWPPIVVRLLKTP